MANALINEKYKKGRYALGIDIGGTFTDIVVLNVDNGTIKTAKELTTHYDPRQGVITGIKKILGHYCQPEEIIRIVHGTTLFTNALIERQGAKTGLITTEGFRDILELGRERKYDIYDLFLTKPTPLVPRELRIEVRESISADGTVLSPLDHDQLRNGLSRLINAGVESVAVSFINAYGYPQHEREAGRLIAQWYPDLDVSLSSEVAAEIKEYERTSTAVANAYVQPLASHYIDTLAGSLEGMGINAPFLMMLSNGGLTDATEAKRFPVRLLESGPAAGALTAASFGAMMGESALIAFDMGGTTAKIALVENNEPEVAYSFEAAREKRFASGSGLPINISTIELIEIGAGGGSIAHIDSLGLLKVGPQSAGSDPGPVCYGFGGEGLTVTDSDMIMGVLNPQFFAGGTMNIDVDAAVKAAAALGTRLDKGPKEIAFGIYEIICENMAAAARVHIAKRGRDPRDFTLFATGGAGPVHAYNVAKKLGVNRVIIPVAAGVASALGMVMAPARIDRVAAVGRSLQHIEAEKLEQLYSEITHNACEVIKRTVGAEIRPVIRRFADMRYSRQGSELVVELPVEPVTDELKDAFARRFEAEYHRNFGQVLDGLPIDIINIRVVVTAETFSGTIKTESENTKGGNEIKGKRTVFLGEETGAIVMTVYDRDRMASGGQFQGPAIIEENDSTLIVEDVAQVTKDAIGNLLITLTGSG